MALPIAFPFKFFILDPKGGGFLSINFLKVWPGTSAHLCSFYFYVIHWILKVMITFREPYKNSWRFLFLYKRNDNSLNFFSFFLSSYFNFILQAFKNEYVIFFTEPKRSALPAHLIFNSVHSGSFHCSRHDCSNKRTSSRHVLLYELQ